MTFQGKLESVSRAINNGGGFLVTFRLDGYPIGVADKTLEVDVKEYRPHRSKDANALLWACLSDIERALNDGCRQTSIRESTWEIYLRMLRRYGKYTYILVKPEAVESVKKQWREAEVYREQESNGQPVVQMICYYGSSTYNSAEMSHLLDGVISEMEEMGLQRPTSAEMKRVMEEWEKKNG